MFYVAITPFIPIGKPIRYQPIINSSRNIPTHTLYGIWYFSVLNKLIGSSFWLYFSKYAIYIVKYASNGVRPIVAHSANLAITWANSGLKLLFMNNGIATVDTIAHLLVVPGTNSVANAIIMNSPIISGIPLNDILLNTFANDIVITGPMFVALKILIKTDPKNININVLPVPSNECVRSSQNHYYF